MLVLDAQNTPEQHESPRGGGTVAGLTRQRFAAQAQAGKLVLFHHNPTKSDEQVDQIIEMAASAVPNAVAATEGLCLSF